MYEEQSCGIILEFGSGGQEEMTFKIFLIFGSNVRLSQTCSLGESVFEIFIIYSSGGHLVWRILTN